MFCKKVNWNSDNQSHVSLVWELGLLAKPKGVVNGEGINGDRQMLGMDLGELLAAGVVPAKAKR